MTYSIVAHHEPTGGLPEWGVAVSSKFLAVGAIVPWGRAGAGVLATQALGNPRHGGAGLDQLAGGESAEAVVRSLVDGDDQRDHRQLGVVDAGGSVATWTGPACHDWAGSLSGDGFACQGNLLTGPSVVEAMGRAFEATAGPMIERLTAALTAGDAVGGDRRGRQSAALLVIRAGGGYQGGSDTAADLRVDDHPDPVGELRRLVGLHRFLFPLPEELVWIEPDDALRPEIRDRLVRLGYDPGSSAEGLRRALFEFVEIENLEERWSGDDRIEVRVLEWLREKTGLDDVRR